MAGVAFDPDGPRRCGSPDQPVQLQPVFAALGAGVPPGVKLHHLSPEIGGGAHLNVLRIDEERDADAGSSQPGDDRPQGRGVAGGVQPALGGDFLAPFRNQADRVRARGQSYADHLVRGCHLQVYRSRDRCLEPIQIVLPYVAAVLPEVQRYSVRARLQGQRRGPHGIRMAAAAGIADGGDVIDVHAQTNLPHASNPCRCCR